MTQDEVTVTVPPRHALDWHSRLGEDMGVKVERATARSVTLTMTPAALADLIADAKFYVDMGYGEYDRTHVDSAKRLLARLEGVQA